MDSLTEMTNIQWGLLLAGKSYEDANSVLEHMFGGSETFSCQDQNLFMHHFKKYLFYTC